MNNILDNITKCRADMQVINYLLDTIPDWKKIVNERHIKFIETYEKYKRQIKMVAATFDFSENDVLSIFWRIQRQLFIEYINRASSGLIKSSKLPDNFDDFLLWSLKQYRDDADKVFAMLKRKIVQAFSINGLNEVRKNKVESILKSLAQAENLILPDNIKLIFEDLKNGINFVDVAKKHHLTVEYLAKSIIGRSKPRYPSERGWLSYIEKREFKVLEFPKGNL